LKLQEKKGQAGESCCFPAAEEKETRETFEVNKMLFFG
jgi:hypothetical protein